MKKQKFHFDLFWAILIIVAATIIAIGLSFAFTYVKFIAIKEAFPDITFWQYYVLTLFGK